MVFRHTYRHHHHKENLYVYLNGKKVLTIKNIKHMADLILKVTDNQDELDALKQRAADAISGIGTAISNAQSVAADLAAFNITFDAQVVPPTAPTA